MNKFPMFNLTMIFLLTFGLVNPGGWGYPQDERQPSEAQISPGTAAPSITGGSAAPGSPMPEALPDEATIWSKVDPLLRSHAQKSLQNGNETPVRLLALAAPSADLGEYGAVLAQSAPDPLGISHVLIETPARLLYKLASRPDVAALASTGHRPAPQPLFPGAPATQPANDTPPAHPRQVLPANRGAQPESWLENDTQGVQEAWALGFQGNGSSAAPLKYAVLDSGVDFCNPALLGRWAVQNNAATPQYNGWAIAYDDYSAGQFLASYPANGSGPGGNWNWYVNAGRTFTGTTFTDAAYAQTFTVLTPSASGLYRYGYHPDSTWNTAARRRGAVLLVTDAVAPGVYDTVVINANRDAILGNAGDVTITQAAPAGCADTSGDAAADNSWGLLYWIADGANPPPGVSAVYENTPVPPAGSVLMFMLNDIAQIGGNHGTMCASTGAGYDNGLLTNYNSILPGWFIPGSSIVAGPGSGGAMGLGAGVDIVAMGNVYQGGSDFNHYYFAAVGYDGVPDSGDEPLIASMSYASSSEDADGWDFASQYLAALNLKLEAEGKRSPLFVKSSGNGGHGYGTVSTPGSSVTGLTVGASTQTGQFNGSWGVYEGVSAYTMTVYQDIAPFSSRGPTAQGGLAPHLVANGAYGTGAIPVNQATFNNGRNGAAAWVNWGGTSRSTPVVAGMAALVYDAYYQGHNTYPDWRLARQILMNSALDLGYDELSAGAGQAYALRATLVASGTYGLAVEPPFYLAGSYLPGSGERFEAFSLGLLPGQSDTAAFTITNPGSQPITVGLRAEQLRQTGSYTTSLTTLSPDPASNYAQGAPDYALDLTPWITAHPSADLMVVRLTYPFSHFDSEPPTPSAINNRWNGLVYNVYDNDHDGIWWNDANTNGRVELSELDAADDHIRFSFSQVRGTQQELQVRAPFQRMGSGGIWFGATHNVNNTQGTTLQIEITFYEEQAWEQVALSAEHLLVPAGGTAIFTATIGTATGPSSYDTPGIYTGRIVVSDPGNGLYAAHDTVIPLVKNVFAQVGPLASATLGGSMPTSTPYDNGRLRGAFSWTGSGETGDWRIFPLLVSDPPAGAAILAQNHWEDYPSDIDTLILDQRPHWDFGTQVPPPYPAGWFGPYTLDDLGSGSVRTGTRPNWNYYTNIDGLTGTSTQEVVSTPANSGLRMILQHAALFGGEQHAIPFTTTIGLLAITPNPVQIGPGRIVLPEAFDLSFTSSMALPDGLALGAAYGWFQPLHLANQPISQDTADITSASWVYALTLSNTIRLDAHAFHAVNASDIDLYVVRDNDSSGTWTPGDTQVAASNTSGANEFVRLNNPANGEYLIAVHGNHVSGTPGNFDIAIENVDAANAMNVSGLPSSVAAGQPYIFTVEVTTLPAVGSWKGYLYFGPPNAPRALEVPVLFDQGAAEKRAWQENAQVGDLITYTLALTPSPGTPVAWSLTDPIPAGMEFVAVEGAAYNDSLNQIEWNGFAQAAGSAVSEETLSPHTITLTARATGSAAGILTNTATLSAGEVSQVSASLEVFQPPTAGFVSSSPDRLGETTLFTNTSLGHPAPAFTWDFGDGFTSTAQTPTHTFAAVGTYTVTLGAASALGVDTFTGTVRIGIAPLAAFTATTPVTYPNTTVDFAFSGIPGSPPTRYRWDFGDGFTSTLPSPAHTYAAPLPISHYTATLSVENDFGADRAAMRIVVVNEPRWITFVYHDLEDVTQAGEALKLGGDFTSWGNQAITMSHDAAYDVFTATIPLLPGSYEYKYIVVSGGDQWYWLNTRNRSLTVSGNATRNDYRNVAVGYAHLMAPAAITITLGANTGIITGEAYIQGVTNPAGMGAYQAQLGYGTGSDPAAWTWVELAYSGQNGNNDVRTGIFTPTASGVYSYAVRFDGNWAAGNPNMGWTYGDLDGVYPGEPFELENTGVLTVIEIQVTDADLLVEKTASAAEVYAGETVTYTITITNDGPADATGVLVTDTLPISATFVSASAGCSEDGGVVSCTVGDLANGESATITIVVQTPNVEGPFVNNVEVTGDQDDPNTANNTASASVLVKKFKLFLPLVMRQFPQP